MSVSATAEFRFVQDLPKRERSKLVNLWEQLKQHHATIAALTAEHGQLVPQSMVHGLLGVCNQRVSQLCQSGKLVKFEVGKASFITEESIVALAKSERKAGRPFKVKAPTLGECANLAREAMRK